MIRQRITPCVRDSLVEEIDLKCGTRGSEKSAMKLVQGEIYSPPFKCTKGKYFKAWILEQSYKFLCALFSASVIWG